jgi:hypothetical protein
MHTHFTDAVNALTPQSLTRFARTDLQATTRIRLQMAPQ